MDELPSGRAFPRLLLSLSKRPILTSLPLSIPLLLAASAGPGMDGGVGLGGSHLSRNMAGRDGACSLPFYPAAVH